MEFVRSEDVGTLQYDTDCNDGQSQTIVLERFRDADALILRGQNMAPLMDANMATAGASGELLGDPDDQRRAQLAGNPVGLFELYRAL